MTKSVTREEMFDLVWQEPRTTLAKRFGMSDVAIAKHSRKANIPMPPPGYWARKQAGKASPRPALPLRLPGQRDLVFPSDEDRFGCYNSNVNLDEIPQPPVFREAPEALVAEAVKRLGHIRSCRELGNPHPGIQRILNDEAKRREAWEKQRHYDYDKPYFDEPHFQRQLRLINSVFWAFDRIDCKGSASRREEWVQGTGQVKYLEYQVCIGDTPVGIQFLEPATPKVLKRVPPTGNTTIRISIEPEGHRDWTDGVNGKLDTQLTSICALMLEVAENRLRSSAIRIYEWRMQRRQDALDEIAQKKAAVEKARREAIAMHHQANLEAIKKMAADHQVAGEIRAFVQTVSGHPECVGSNIDLFQSWSNNAISFADSIDPLRLPISKIFDSYLKLPAAMSEFEER